MVAAIVLSSCIVASPTVLAQATVDVSIDTAAGSTRLLLTHSAKVVYAIRELGTSIEIVYVDPVDIRPAAQELGNSTFLGYEVKEGRRLVLNTGPAFGHFDSFELRNPFRIVVDLQARRDSPDTVPLVPQTPRHDPSQTIIVIDPGHGGVEKGAVGPTGLQEKNVALDISRRLRQALQQDPSTSVVLTRDEDRVVGLDERTAIANHNNADLFISIHLNSSPRSTAMGAETYFLANEATDDEARTLAALENRSSGVAEGSLVVEGEKKRNLDLVLWDLAQNRFIAQSSALAESVQGHMNDLVGTRDRGVRQAPFRVLMGATMPAILVEVGFVSNREEEERLKTLTYRTAVVDALAAAVRDFLRDLKRLNGPASYGVSTPSRP